MSNLQFTRTLFGTLAILFFLTLAARRQAFGATESVLWSFGKGSDGNFPQNRLLMDSGGNLYGATSGGGAYSRGTAFELTPPSTAGGPWTETVLWNFGTGTDGNAPQAGLIMDSNGNLYGTTGGGGAYGGGTAFELTPPSTSGGNWTESILWNFGNGNDSNNPIAGLVMDKNGNLYGTTNVGGDNGKGTAFELTPPSTEGGDWTESVLWSFGKGADGALPRASLIIDGSGNLNGTTVTAGTFGHGTVFELTPPSSVGDTWTQSVLWNFGNGTDGAGLYSDLVMDSSGVLYGTTSGGGVNNKGTAFKLTSPSTSGGSWAESILWNFGKGADGAGPADAGLVIDAGGNLYGVTFQGGAYGQTSGGHGTAFKLKPPTTSRGKWTESILWSFGIGDDGIVPNHGLILDGSGNLYGTTTRGGAYYSSIDLGGTVFEISPTPSFNPTVLSASAKLLNFGKLLVTQTSKPKKVTLINKGKVAAQISDVGVTVGMTAPFDLAGGPNSCSGESIPPKGTCSFYVEFAPTVAGTFSSSDYTIRVTYNGTSPALGLIGSASPNIPK